MPVVEPDPETPSKGGKQAQPAPKVDSEAVTPKSSPARATPNGGGGIKVRTSDVSPALGMAAGFSGLGRGSARISV